MVALLAALALGGDPYHGFRARYVPFSGNMLTTFDVKTLEERGYDMTSLIYLDRERIAKTLRRAGKDGAAATARFDGSDVRLAIHLGKETWYVDRYGTVLHDGAARPLATYHFTELRQTVIERVPDVKGEYDAVYGRRP